MISVARRTPRGADPPPRYTAATLPPRPEESPIGAESSAPATRRSSTGTPSRFPPGPLLPWAFAALTFLVRVPDLRWGLPQPEEETLPVMKAFAMWGWDEGRLTLDPQTAGWPALSFYVNLALQHLQYALGRLTGRYGEPLDFFVQHVDVATLLVPSRFLNLLFGAATVLVGVRLARRLTGDTGALLTGLVLAFSPLLVKYSLNVAPDGLATLCAALALTCCVDLVERGRTRDYVGAAVWIGLGAATKYTPVLLAPCVVAAHLARSSAPSWRTLIAPRLPLAAGVAAAAFFAASPYTVLDAATAQRDFASQVTRLAGEGHFGHELVANGWIFYPADALPAALGWPVAVLGLAGLAWAAWRRGGAWWPLLAAFAAFYAGLGALRSPFDHYLLPVLLPVVLGAAALAQEAARRARAAAVVGAALLAVPSAWASARQHVRYAHTTTNNEARAFILEELAGPGVTFASEIGGPELPRSPEADLAGRGVWARLRPEQRARLLERPFVHRYIINLYMTAAEGADLYYDLRHCLDYDYVVVSGKARGRYEALAGRFPRQNEFYADLARYCELVRHVAASPARLGPDVWIYRVGPSARRILADRGELAPGFERPFLDRARRSDLQAFLGFTGGVAMQREDWRAADLYLGTLLDLVPENRAALLLPLAKVKFNAGDLPGAARLCAEHLQRAPGDAEALALAAAIRARG